MSIVIKKGAMSIVIEKGVPIPSPRGESRLVAMSMEVGDSVVIDGKEGRETADVATWNYRFKPLRFVSRKIGPGKARVWRIA